MFQKQVLIHIYSMCIYIFTLTTAVSSWWCHFIEQGVKKIILSNHARFRQKHKHKLNIIFSIREGCIRTARESRGRTLKFENGKTHTGRREWKTVSPHRIQPSLWWDHWCPSLQRQRKHQSPMRKWKKTLLNHSSRNFWRNCLTAYFSQSEKQETFQKKMWGIIIINISVVWATMTHCTAQRCNYG